MIDGGFSLSSAFCCLMLTPPKMTETFTDGRYALKRSNSCLIWYASSRVWQRISAPTSPGGEGIASRRDLGAKSAGRNWRN